MTVGDCIRSARRNAGITQKELGKRIGMSQQQLAQYENNSRNPKGETLQRIADALGIDLSELMAQYVPSFGAQVIVNANETEKLKMLTVMDQLNPSGQQKAVERVEELTEIPKYQKAKEPSQETQDG